jgi:hypothetical protein
MKCLYWNNKINYETPFYKNYILWEPINNKEGWCDIDIPVSSQLKKYFKHKNVNNFLVGKKDKYLIVVIYKDNYGMDMLPCFTETMKYGENITDAKKRFLQEELFSNSDVDFLAKNKWQNQQIYTLHTNINNILSNCQNMIEDNREDNKYKKINLLVVIDKKEDADVFIDNWRSKRHNLGIEAERLYMIDLCLVKVSDIIT